MRKLDATDQQLLSDFVREHDPIAFRNLVSRHGPAVLQVCRSVLQDPHEADDAFQATFLVLVRKAPSIQAPDALGGWLRGVAYRTATRARCRAARRRAVERASADATEPRSVCHEWTPDLRDLLREELDRLPDSYREPVTLCYLEGMTHQEAARRLGWPLGTVKVRLVRARNLLKERLDRRGVAPWAFLMICLLKPPKASAAPLAGPATDGSEPLLTLTDTARRNTLTTRLARPLELARAAFALWAVLDIRWLWVAVTLVAIVLGLSVPAVFAVHGHLAPDVDPLSLPINLTDILNVQCR